MHRVAALDHSDLCMNVYRHQKFAQKDDSACSSCYRTCGTDTMLFIQDKCWAPDEGGGAFDFRQIPKKETDRTRMFEQEVNMLDE